MYEPTALVSPHFGCFLEIAKYTWTWLNRGCWEPEAEVTKEHQTRPKTSNFCQCLMICMKSLTTMASDHENKIYQVFGSGR